MKLTSLIVAIGLVGPSVALLAQQRTQTKSQHPDIQKRCKDDSLDARQANNRLDWAKRNNVVPQDALEDMRYVVKGGKVHKRDRPRYPMFGVYHEKAEQIVIWKPEQNGWAKTLPKNIDWIAVCTASCYTDDQELLTGQGYIPIAEAVADKIPSIMVVEEGSEIGAIKLVEEKIGKYTASFRETDHEIVVVNTKSGGQLKVTPGHVVLDGRGVLKTASDLVLGDSLVTEHGDLDEIVDISRVDYYGSVYNVKPETLNAVKNLVVAGGYINGSDRYQNDWASKQGTQLLVKRIPDNLFDAN